MKTCPNCGQPIENHPDNGCALRTLIQVVRERGGLTEEQLLDLHVKCDVDALWDQLGHIVDQLEAGDFSTRL